jgi:hypothetical protein
MFLHLSLYIIMRTLKADYIGGNDGCRLIWSLLFASSVMNNVNTEMYTSVIWLVLLKKFAGGGDVWTYVWSRNMRLK